MEMDPRTKQEPLDYEDPMTMANTNGALSHNFPGILNLPAGKYHTLYKLSIFRKERDIVFV